MAARIGGAWRPAPACPSRTAGSAICAEVSKSMVCK
jgi:hypothetical protein